MASPNLSVSLKGVERNTCGNSTELNGRLSKYVLSPYDVSRVMREAVMGLEM